MEFNWVHSSLRSLIGLLCQPRVIMMMVKLVEWWLVGETEVLEENLPATLSTTNPTWLDPGLNSDRRGGKPATNRLSYGATFGTQLKKFERNKNFW
jgi:hypothetical protein